MESNDLGCICVLKKDGSEATRVPLSKESCTFGSSNDATIRLKMENSFLRDIHCQIEVQEDGVAILINKCKFHPINLNGAPLHGETALAHADVFEIINRKFVYINENITSEEIKGYKRKKELFPKCTPFKSRRTMLPRFVGLVQKKTIINTETTTELEKQKRPSTHLTKDANLAVSTDCVFKTPLKTPKIRKSASCSKAFDFSVKQTQKDNSTICSISNTSFPDFDSLEGISNETISPNPSVRTRSASKTFNENDVESPCLLNFSRSSIAKKLRPSRCSKNLSYSVDSKRLTEGNVLSRNSLPITVTKSKGKRASSVANKSSIANDVQETYSTRKDVEKTMSAKKSSSKLSRSVQKSDVEGNDESALEMTEYYRTFNPQDVKYLTPKDMKKTDRQTMSAKKSNSKLSRSIKKSDNSDESNESDSEMVEDYNEEKYSTPKDAKNVGRQTVSAKKSHSKLSLSVKQSDNIVENNESDSEMDANYLEEKYLTPKDSKNVGRQTMSAKKSNSKLSCSIKKSDNTDENNESDSEMVEDYDEENYSTPKDAKNIAHQTISAKKSNSKLSRSIKKSDNSDENKESDSEMVEDYNEEKYSTPKDAKNIGRQTMSAKNSSSKLSRSIKKSDNTNESDSEMAENYHEENYSTPKDAKNVGRQTISAKKSNSKLQRSIKNDSNEENDEGELETTENYPTLTPHQKRYSTPKDVKKTGHQTMSAKKSTSKLNCSVKKPDIEVDNESDSEMTETCPTLTPQQVEQPTSRSTSTSKTISLDDTFDSISTPTQLERSNKRKSASSKKLSNSSKTQEEPATNKSFNFQEEFDKTNPCVTPEQSKQIPPVSIKKSHSKVRRSAKKASVNPNETFGTPVCLLEMETGNVESSLTPLQVEKSVRSVKKSNVKNLDKSVNLLEAVITPIQSEKFGVLSGSAKKSSVKTRKSVRYSTNTKDNDNSTIDLLGLCSTPMQEEQTKRQSTRSNSAQRRSASGVRKNKSTESRDEENNDEDLYLTPVQQDNVPPLPISIKKSNAKSRKSGRRSTTLSDAEATPVLSKSSINISHISIMSSPGTPALSISERLRKSGVSSDLSQSFLKLKELEQESPGVQVSKQDLSISSTRSRKSEKNSSFRSEEDDELCEKEGTFKTPLKVSGEASAKKSAKKSMLLSTMTSTPNEKAVVMAAAVSSIKKGVKRQLQESMDVRSTKRVKLGTSIASSSKLLTDEDSSLFEQYLPEDDSTSRLSHSQRRDSVSTRRSLRQRQSSNQENVQSIEDSEVEVQESLLESTRTSSILFDNSPHDYNSQQIEKESAKKLPLSPRNSIIGTKGNKVKAKSPKNDLTDIRGVKKLLATPKEPKSPRNDLTDVKGVKKLLATPRETKTPKNDLTDIKGVKKLLATPKEPKSPRNDLTDVKGVKKLLTTPKEYKSPKNELSDFRGLKKLMRTPAVQSSPKNDLTNVRGVKKLLETPKEPKSPKNELEDLQGVKEIFESFADTSFTKNERLNISGIEVLENDNEHNFDALCGRKHFSTYRGKSLSPIKQKPSVPTIVRMSMGTGVVTKKPEVEKWVQEQQMWAEKVKTVVPIEEAENNKSKGTITNSKSKKRKEESKKPLEIEQENEEKDETPSVRTRGGRSKKTDSATSEKPAVKVSTPQKSTRNTRKAAKIETSESSNVEDVDSVKPKSTRTRTKRGNQVENEPEPDEIATEVDDAKAKTTRTRARRGNQAENEPEPDETPTEVDGTKAKTIRTRAKRANQVEGKPESDESPKEVEDAKAKSTRTRGKRAIQAEDKPEQDKAPKAKTRRTNRKASVDGEPVVVTPLRKTRSRKPTDDLKENKSKEDESNKLEDNIQAKLSPIKTRRGRPKKTVAEEEQGKKKAEELVVLKEVTTNEISPPKTRQRRNVRHKSEETENADPAEDKKKKVRFESEDESSVTDKGRSTRGKRKAAVEKAAAEPVRKSCRTRKTRDK